MRIRLIQRIVNYSGIPHKPLRTIYNGRAFEWQCTICDKWSKILKKEAPYFTCSHCGTKRYNPGLTTGWREKVGKAFLSYRHLRQYLRGNL